MKKIVCELCEGTEFTKEDGMFVCQGCGTKYTTEEAKGMMRDVEGGVPPVGAPAMPAGNPNQQQIDNMLMLATNAYDASNNKEAENYCNQVIALDATFFKAWFLKGKAIGWQSTLANMRLSEAAHSFGQAIDFAPEEEKEDVKNQAVEELKRLGLACIALRKDRFAKYPDEEELAGFAKDRKELLNALTVLLAKGNAVGIPDGYLEEVASMMNQAAVAAYNRIRDDYNNKNRPNINDWKKAVDGIENCIDLIESAIEASDKDDEKDITRYENLIVMYEFCIDLRAYSYYNSRNADYGFTDEFKAAFRERITSNQLKIKKLKDAIGKKKAAEAKKAEEEKKARLEVYWEAHADEKKALDAEKSDLEKKKANLVEEINKQDNIIAKAVDEKRADVPSQEESWKIRDQIKELQNRRSGLGIFANKEKKQIDEEITALEDRRSALNGKIEEEQQARNAEAEEKIASAKTKRNDLQKQLDTVMKRISTINATLSKDPAE